MDEPRQWTQPDVAGYLALWSGCGQATALSDKEASPVEARGSLRPRVGGKTCGSCTRACRGCHVPWGAEPNLQDRPRGDASVATAYDAVPLRRQGALQHVGTH